MAAIFLFLFRMTETGKLMTPGRQNDNDLHISSILIGPLNPQNGLLAQKKYKFLGLGIAAAPVEVCRTSFLKFPGF